MLSPITPMNLDKQAQIKAHALAIAALLYEETDPDQLQTLARIEQTVRRQVLEHISPEIGVFLSPLAPGQSVGENVPSTAASDD